MALTDYEELSARSFEELHDPELRAAVQVCADALAQIDDPRGPLISLEYALYDETTSTQKATNYAIKRGAQSIQANQAQLLGWLWTKAIAEWT